MNAETMFWFLLALGVVELLAIFLTGMAIKSLVTSDLFKQKLIRRDQLKAEQDKKNNDGIVKGTGVLLALLVPSLLFGQAEAEADPFSPWINITEGDLYIIGTINLFLLGVLWYMKNVLSKLIKIDHVAEEVAAAEEETTGAKIMHILTDAVPLEEEESLDMGHDYDGIRELDNNLPPWWKWGFVATIIYAVVHLSIYHFFQADDLQIAEYQNEMAEADLAVQQWMSKQAMNVDEYSVVAMTAMGDLNNGKATFMQYCKQCHGEYGEGKVGPNLCDDYWIYGNDIKDIFKTVKYGAKRGMKSWTDELNPIQIQEVASYLQTFQGTTPPVALKDAEGDFYPIGGETSEPEQGEPADEDGDAEQTLEAGV